MTLVESAPFPAESLRTQRPHGLAQAAGRSALAGGRRRSGRRPSVIPGGAWRAVPPARPPTGGECA